MSFLPPGYNPPQSSSGNYMKLEEGENKIRILSEAKIGFEGWKDRKCFRHEGTICRIKVEDVDTNRDGMPNINHFWAFLVWNYNAKKIQILEITQKTIMRSITTFVHDEDFGDPKGYDIVINKTKAADKITYNLLAKPPRPVSPEIEEAFANTKVTLDSLFTNRYQIDESEPAEMQEEDLI